MTKPQLRILERIWAAEINGTLPLDIKSNKQTDWLEREGYIEFVSKNISDLHDPRGPIYRLPLIVDGFVLTHRGRIAYCESCANVEVPDV